MAHLNWHGKIVRTWKHKIRNTQFHLTETGWLIKTTGPRLGGAKIVARPKEEQTRHDYFHMLSNTDAWESTLIY